MCTANAPFTLIFLCFELEVFRLPLNVAQCLTSIMQFDANIIRHRTEKGRSETTKRNSDENKQLSAARYCYEQQVAVLM